MIALCGAAALSFTGCAGGDSTLQAAPVARESISQTVTATGSLSPQDTILVGSQDSGTIQSIYVDYNSEVHVGEVLAQLDPTNFKAALSQAQATLGQLTAQRSAAGAVVSSSQYTSAAARESAQSARAQIRAADEDVRKARSALALAVLTLHRDRELLRQGFSAQNVVDADVTNEVAARDALVAAQTSAQAARLGSAASANAAGSSAAQVAGAVQNQHASDQQVAAARASVAQAQYNLDHATIVSPVDGTVIQRNVSVGQTVAAALQAPTLFTIAKDLHKMELDIAVGEPDVGAVHVGQPVVFSVLAYPGRTFVSSVDQVRQNPTIVNNVTTYDTVAYPSNLDGALRSGMTANVQITVATYRDALVVPLAALQWRPSAAVAKRYRIVGAPAGAQPHLPDRSTWGTTGGSAEFAVSVGGSGHVYVLNGNELDQVRVRVLAIDGTRVGIEIVNGRLSVGTKVVTGEVS